jgi:hypothetical protein
MKNSDANKQEKEFPVREGSEKSSVLHDQKLVSENDYPRPEQKDVQAKNQPEFTEEQPNRVSTDNTKQ